MARLEHVITRNLTELRTEQGDTQSSLAEKMRAIGFTWSTNRVAQVETLRRPVSLIEVVGLAAAFGVPVSRLLKGDDDVSLPSGETVPLAMVRASLTGECHFEAREVSAVDTDDLRRMAAKMGLRPPAFDALARRVFGRSFRSEGDSRLGDTSGLSKRSAQTKRGHVTRALLAELASDGA